MRIKKKDERVQQEIAELKGILVKDLETLALRINRIDYKEKDKRSYGTLGTLYYIREKIEDLLQGRGEDTGAGI